MIKSRNPSVLYLCNALDEATSYHRQITTDSPAATNKVVGLAEVMRQIGLRCIVLSLGRGRQNGKGKWYPVSIRRCRSTTILYCGFLHLPILTHIISAISLVFIIVSIARRYPNLTLLSYNRSYHYVPALIMARFIHVRSCLDLEDGYIYEDGGRARYFKNELTRRLFQWLCPHGAMVANTGLGLQLDRTPTTVCYGVAKKNTLMPLQDWQSRPLQVIFGGSLMEELGSKLIVDAINILRHEHPELVNQLHFVVTGKGPFAETFKVLATLAKDWLSFKESIKRAEYLDVLANSHVGLSIRLSSFEMGATTFPSKVIEFADHGLLVLTTRISDVPLLFGDSALYLENETAPALAEMLASLPSRSYELSKVANLGREKVLNICSPEIVGINLYRLVSNEGLLE